MYIIINKVTRSGATTNVFILIVFGCIVFYAGTYMDIEGNVLACREYRGIQGNTGKYIGIHWNTLKSVIGDYRLRKDVFIGGNV